MDGGIRWDHDGRRDRRTFEARWSASRYVGFKTNRSHHRLKLTSTQRDSIPDSESPDEPSGPGSRHSWHTSGGEVLKVAQKAKAIDALGADGESKRG